MQKWLVESKMWDAKTRRAFERMSDIGHRVTNDAVRDYRLLYELKDELTKPGNRHAVGRENANLGLMYLLLFHPSPLIRHEAAFMFGEYGKPCSFLRSVAFLDEDATVRHEAALAMSTKSQRAYVDRNKWVL